MKFILLFGSTVALCLPAQSYPFYNTPESFQAYVNQMWKTGGSGLSAGQSFDTNDPTHTARRYFNFHNCNYSQPQNREQGSLWEQFSCDGYVYHESPIRTFTCKITASYLAYNNQYLGGSKSLIVGETSSFKMCNEWVNLYNHFLTVVTYTPFSAPRYGLYQNSL